MKTIMAKDLQVKMNRGEPVQIIDVREDFEVSTGKIPGAKHLALSRIAHELGELNKNSHYYIVCQSGGRSARACEFLSHYGYHVTNVNGGMMAWPGKIE